MKVPWDEIPEVYDPTPPWEKAPECPVHKEVGESIERLNNVLVGYQAGLTSGNEHTAVGYTVGNKNISLGCRSILCDSDWYHEQSGKVAKLCSQCGGLLFEMGQCYMCHTRGSSYTIME